MQQSWPNTKITESLKIHFPIIQAPMAGGATTPELIAAVSNAGGLGSLGAGYMTPYEIRNTIKQVRELTDKPFCVNLFIPERHQATNDQIEISRKIIQEACHELDIHINTPKPPYAPSFEEQMNVILEEKFPVFSFTFGIPDVKWIEALKKNGTLLIGTATSVEEAIILEKHSVDVVVAQGSEAGGHRGTFIGKAEESLTNISLLVSLIDKHIKIPVIAAGAVMDAKGIYTEMRSGASAVQMGTAFLCCSESGIHPLYKQSLLNAKQNTTALTRAFSGKLARGLVNKFIVRMKSHEDTILDYPIQNALTSIMRKEAGRKNFIDFMSMWAGEGAHLCKALPASQLIQELNDKMLALINNR
ncbi:MAG: nitronate monooxygenase [Gammaproteobacteria bacterium]|nr:nitronate monooxygenase [Gammaproteobacteria bacterium]MCW5583653.1 nitronate monooxygenase [Gammaproteobacteria bacterium]